MSRHTVSDPKGRRFAYGYDRPLQYFWLTQETNRGGGPVFRHLVGLLSCPEVYGSALNLLDAIDRYKLPVPAEHRERLMLDLPI